MFCTLIFALLTDACGSSMLKEVPPGEERGICQILPTWPGCIPLGSVSSLDATHDLRSTEVLASLGSAPCLLEWGRSTHGTTCPLGL